MNKPIMFDIQIKPNSVKLMEMTDKEITKSYIPSSIIFKMGSILFPNQ